MNTAKKTSKKVVKDGGKGEKTAKKVPGKPVVSALALRKVDRVMKALTNVTDPDYGCPVEVKIEVLGEVLRRIKALRDAADEE